MNPLPRPPQSLRERAAQLVFPRIGSNMPPPRSVDDDAERVHALLDDVPVGGLVLFHGRHASSAAILGRLQNAAPYPLLVAADLERGAGQQLAGATVFPHAMAFGAVGDRAPAFVHHAAWVTAREAVAGGVHWLLAPVADVHSNPDNPIISTRAFGRDPVVVGELAQAFIAGAREGGALTTAKHFPGHGDTDTDSHDALPVMSGPRERLDRIELAPFRAAIAAGVDAVMTAHVAYPALDPAGVSATGSAAMLRRLLRDELGFGGVVVSDSLLMGGAGADGDTVSRTVPDLVRAGVDVLLDVSDPRAAVDALVRAVTNGDLDERLLDEAFQRVWSMKTRVAGRGASPSDGREARELADTVASLAVQVDAGSPAALAALLEAPDVPIAVIRPHTTYPDPTRSDAESVLSAMLPWARVHAVGPDTTEQQRAAVAEAAAAAGGCVAVLVVKPAAWHRFGLRPEQDRLVAALTQAVPTLVCVLGSPDVVDRYGQAAGRVRVYSDVEASVRALAARLAELRRSPVV